MVGRVASLASSFFCFFFFLDFFDFLLSFGGLCLGEDGTDLFSSLGDCGLGCRKFPDASSLGEPSLVILADLDSLVLNRPELWRSRSSKLALRVVPSLGRTPTLVKAAVWVRAGRGVRKALAVKVPRADREPLRAVTEPRVELFLRLPLECWLVRKCTTMCCVFSFSAPCRKSGKSFT